MYADNRGRATSFSPEDELINAACEFGAGKFAALHLALNLPGDDALERARFALGEQTVLLEEVVKIRSDVLLFHELCARFLQAEAVAHSVFHLFQHSAGNFTGGQAGKTDRVEGAELKAKENCLHR